MPTLNEYINAAKEIDDNDTKSRFQDYLNAMIPVLTMVIPLFFLDPESYTKTDFSIYVKMIVSTLIPLLVVDLPKVLNRIMDTFTNTKDGKLSDLFYTSHGISFIYYYEHMDVLSNKLAYLKHKDMITIITADLEIQPNRYYAYYQSYEIIDMIRQPSLLYVKELNLEIFIKPSMSGGNNYHCILGYPDEYKIRDFIKWLQIVKSKQDVSSSIYILKETVVQESKEKNNESNPKINKQTKLVLQGKNKSILDKCILTTSNETLLYSILTKFTDAGYIHKLDTIGLNNNLFLLFHGPPGTSKTTISMGIATYLDRDVILVDKTTPDMFFDYASQIDYSKYVILMDDIDFWDMSSREEGKSKNLLRLMEMLNGNTFSGGCIIFTTNHLDKFDPALFREGRVHLKLHITPLIQQSMWDKFIKNIYGSTTVVSTYFTKVEMNKLCSQEIPLCTLSELVKSHFESIETFITEIKHKYL